MGCSVTAGSCLLAVGSSICVNGPSCDNMQAGTGAPSQQQAACALKGLSCDSRQAGTDCLLSSLLAIDKMCFSVTTGSLAQKPRLSGLLVVPLLHKRLAVRQEQQPTEQLCSIGCGCLDMGSKYKTTCSGGFSKNTVQAALQAGVVLEQLAGLPGSASNEEVLQVRCPYTASLLVS